MSNSISDCSYENLTPCNNVICNFTAYFELDYKFPMYNMAVGILRLSLRGGVLGMS